MTREDFTNRPLKLSDCNLSYRQRPQTMVAFLIADTHQNGRRLLGDIGDAAMNVPALPLVTTLEGAVSFELGSDFRSLSREDQISKCHEMAREATRLAANSNDEKRAEYSALAAGWSALASEMEKSR